MSNPDWFDSLPAAVTMCDAKGILIYMNSAAESLFAKNGGRALLGSSVFDCHPREAQEKLRKIMRNRESNTYTVEKAGKKRLIHQSPWYQNGEYAGFTEISFDIPPALPNFVRK